MKAPTNTHEALHQLAEDLRRDNFLAVAAVVEAGYRELAGSLLAELSARRADPVTCAMVRAWGARHDRAILAGYQSLCAPETDSDADEALAAIVATSTADALTHDVARLRAVVDQLTALGATWRRSGRGIGECDALDEIEGILDGLRAGAAS